MSIKQFTRFGYSYSHGDSITSTYNATGFALTADTSNSPSSLAVPAHCFLESIELQATAGSVGGFTFTIGKDFHFDSSVSDVSDGTLYLFAKAATGNLSVNIRLNWRA